MRRKIWMLGFLLCGCHQTSSVQMPPAFHASNISSAIVVIEVQDGQTSRRTGTEVQDALEAWAVSKQEPIRFAAPQDATLTLLLYASPLFDLGLTPGRLLPSKRPHRRLPTSDESYGAQIVDERVEWTSGATLSDALRQFRIRGLSVEDCARANGCYASTDDATDNQCSIPCPRIDTIDDATPPEPPQLPRLPSCPSGWQLTDFEVMDGCLPPPRRDCSDGWQPISETDCRTLQSGCSASGRYNDSLPTTATITYVDGSAAPGEGTIDRPFNSLSTALTSGATTIALAKGTYEGRFELGDDVQIIGACAAETKLLPSNTQRGPVLLVVGNNTRLRNLSVEPADVTLKIESGANATIEDLRLRGDVVVEGALEANRIVLTEAAQDGLLVLGTANIENSVIGGAARSAVLAFGGQVSLGTTVIERCTTGIIAASDGRVVMAESSIEASRCDGIKVEHGSLSIDDSVLRGTERCGEGYGSALMVMSGSVAISRSVIEDTEATGLRVTGGNVQLEDVVIDGVGRGLLGERLGMDIKGGEIVAQRVLIRDTVFRAVRHILGALVLRDVTLRGFSPTWDGRVTVLRINGDVDVELERVAIDGAPRESLILGDVDEIGNTEVTIHDLQITNSRSLPGHPETSACVIDLRPGVQLTATRVAIEGADFGGICLSGGELLLDDLTVIDVDDAAIAAWESPKLTVNRALLEGAFHGIHFAGIPRINLSNIKIQEMKPGVTETGSQYLGRGLYIFPTDAPTMTISRFAISSCAVGIESIVDSVEATDGIIERNTIGARIRFQPATLMKRVLFQDNDQDFVPFE